MRLRWTWMAIVMAACAYILACAYAPPAGDTPAVDTSGVELAPAESAPAAASRGVVSTARAEAARLANGLANAVAGRVPAKRRAVRAGTPGGGFLSPDIVPGCCCCCDPCCCDPCCCEPCDPCGGGGGGCSANYSCVTDGTIPNPATTCGGADQYPLVAMERGTPYDMSNTVEESTSCLPSTEDTKGGGYACSIYYTGGTPPTDGGSCLSGATVLHAPAPVLRGADANGYLTWAMYPGIDYMQDLNVTCANSCYVEQFSISTSEVTNLGPVPPCN